MSNPTCKIMLAECIKSGQVSADQIEAHRVLDTAIAQPEQPAQRNLTGSELGVIHRALLRSGNVITAIAQPKDKP